MCVQYNLEVQHVYICVEPTSNKGYTCNYLLTLLNDTIWLPGVSCTSAALWCSNEITYLLSGTLQRTTQFKWFCSLNWPWGHHIFHGHHVVTLLTSRSHRHNLEMLPGFGFISLIVQNKGNKPKTCYCAHYSIVQAYSTLVLVEMLLYYSDRSCSVCSCYSKIVQWLNLNLN